jgi:hypothetical protein
LSEELTVLIEVALRLEKAGMHYMLTGSMAMNLYATPRMTRDLDFVVAIAPGMVSQLAIIFPEEEYYLSAEAATDAVKRSSCFNIIHLKTMMKIDVMVRKNEEFRMLEFTRRQRHNVSGEMIWVVSKEDLILSKLEWSLESESTRQIEDVKNLLATGCDQNYINQWAQKLQLTNILTRATA